MKKTAFALITCTAAVTLLAGCGSEAGVHERDAGAREADAGITSQLPDTKEDLEDLQDLPDTDEEILIARPDPTLDVTAEEFQDMLGYSFLVPEGARDIYYTVDTDSNVGMMQFTLDGVFWSAQVLQRDVYIRLDHPYIGDGGIEITCDFKDDPALKVHGVDPELRGYRVRYSEDQEQYIYSANWFLEKEGYSISLGCHSDTRIDSMPVEVFP